MKRRARILRSGRLRIAGVSVLALMATTLGTVGMAPAASAHGTSSDPASRAFQCRFDIPLGTNPMCDMMWNDGVGALNDWMSIADGASDSQAEARIPDGKLCSGNNSKFDLLDTPSADWPTTNMVPDSSGNYHVSWINTAPHKTLFYRVYLSKQDYDASQALTWGDLEQVYEKTYPQPFWDYNDEQSGKGSTTDLSFPLPTRSGHMVLYQVWQRSDSQEAFFSCSDVTVNQATASPTSTPTPTTTSAEPEPTASPEPTTASPEPTSSETTPTPTSGPDSVSHTVTNSTDWGDGYCADVTVSTTNSLAIPWAVEVDLDSGPNASIMSLWNAEGTVSAGVLSARGGLWNDTVTASSPATFGFCATRG